MKEPVIEIKHFKKYYGDFKAVDIDYLNIYPGEILALLGPNGAGKTSTLETLEGLRDYNEGDMTIKGHNLKKEYNKIRKYIGVQLQAQSLPANITVIEAMELFCSYYKVETRYDLLERFGLNEFENRQFSKLSVGQQRKLSLAIAIAHQPEILILDEPTAGLDVTSKAELHDILKELRENNTAIILSSHDMFEVEKLADRIAIMFKGKIIKIGTPSEIKNSYDLIKVGIKTKNNSLMNYSHPLIINSRQNEGVFEYYLNNQNVHDVLNQLIKAINNNQDQIIDITIEKTTLEERFIALTNGGVKS